jgi:Flp pilus assembly protein TadG
MAMGGPFERSRGPLTQQSKYANETRKNPPQLQKRISARDENGQTMTEFALILPILALLLFAVIQFGIVFNNYLTVTDAARAGARKGAVGRYVANPGGEAEQAARDSAVNLDQSQFAVSVSSTWQPGETVSVTTSYPYEISLVGLVVQSGTLESTTTERVE